MNRPAHVVVLGCGRSGTSIFGELFRHIPGYTYISEPPFGDLRGYDYTTPVAVKIPRPTAGRPVSPGLPFLVDELLAVVPEPRKIFWLVRHPLDAICSLRVGIGKNWGHHPRPPDWQSWLSEPLLRRCAHHWLHINTAGYDCVRHLAAITRFEDMILDPLGVARRTGESAGIDTSACDRQLRGWANRVQNENNEDFDEAETSKSYSRPDHATRVGRWRENLSADEAADLIPLVSSTAAQFGYALPATGR